MRSGSIFFSKHWLECQQCKGFTFMILDSKNRRDHGVKLEKNLTNLSVSKSIRFVAVFFFFFHRSRCYIFSLYSRSNQLYFYEKCSKFVSFRYLQLCLLTSLFLLTFQCPKAGTNVITKTHKIPLDCCVWLKRCFFFHLCLSIYDHDWCRSVPRLRVVTKIRVSRSSAYREHTRKREGEREKRRRRVRVYDVVDENRSTSSFASSISEPGSVQIYK